MIMSLHLNDIRSSKEQQDQRHGEQAWEKKLNHREKSKNTKASIFMENQHKTSIQVISENEE